MINHLISLIQTLSPKEKTAFKRFSSLTSENRILSYVILFDIYNKLLNRKITEKDWDKKLNTSLKKHPEIQKNLSSVKNRLKEKILESLVAHETNSNLQFQFALSLNVIEVLYKRNLYGEMHARINQLKKQAKKREAYGIMVQLLGWEMKLFLRESKKDDLTAFEKAAKQQQYYSKLNNIELNLKSIYQNLTLIVQRDLQLIKPVNREAFEKLGMHSALTNLIIDKHESERNVRIVLLFYKTQNLFYRYLGEFEKSYDYSKRLINFFETDQPIIKSFEREYIAAMCGHSRVCARLKKEEELGQLIEKVKSIYKVRKDFDSLSATCDMGINHYRNTLQYNKAEELINVLDKEWKDIQNKISDGKQLFYAYNNFLVYWILGNDEKIQKWTREALSISRANKGKGIYFIARLLSLTYEYDQKQFLYLNEKINAFQKTLGNNDHLTSFEKITLHYLKSLLDIAIGKTGLNLNQKQKNDLSKETFESFKSELLALANCSDKFVTPTGYDKILLWIESHLQQKSIREVFEVSVL